MSATMRHEIEVDVTFTISVELDEEFNESITAEHAREVAANRIRDLMDALGVIHNVVGDLTGPSWEIGETKVLERWETM
jgi:hypothetical protein